MDKVITMSVEEWIEKFNPIYRKSELSELLADSYDLNDYMFDTYGEDIEELRKLASKYSGLHFWTWLSEGDMEWISEGIRYVNRMGYFVTREPAIENVAYDIIIFEPDENDYLDYPDEEEYED